MVGYFNLFIIMTLDEIREKHKVLHWNKKVQKQVIKERLEMWWSVEDTITKGNWKDGKYRPHRIEKRKENFFI